MWIPYLRIVPAYSTAALVHTALFLPPTGGENRDSAQLPSPPPLCSTSPRVLLSSLGSALFFGRLISIGHWNRGAVLLEPHPMLPNNQVRVSSTRVVSQLVSSDITDKFTKAASGKRTLTWHLTLVYLFTDIYSELNTGQLVKDEYFTLFEAVGALEVCVTV